MNLKVYVDETKAKDYLVVAAGGTHTDLQVCGKELRNLILPGQRALHMRDERDQRRRAIADTITRMADVSITATVYNAGRRGHTEKDRRRRCLEAIVTDAAALDNEVRITFDLDQSLLRWDRQQMIELTRAAGTKDRVSYLHSTRQTEVLLGDPGRDRLELGTRRCLAPTGRADRGQRPTGVKDPLPRNARSPSATVVRPGLGLTSWSSTLQTHRSMPGSSSAINRLAVVPAGVVRKPG